MAIMVRGAEQYGHYEWDPGHIYGHTIIPAPGNEPVR